jgi:hypothetical protein
MKRWLELVAIVLLIASGTAALMLGRSSDPINEYNYDRIRTGMTEPEIERVLQRPGSRRQFPCKQLNSQVWGGKGEIRIIVWYDQYDRVESKSFVRPNLREKIRHLIGL